MVDGPLQPYIGQPKVRPLVQHLEAVGIGYQARRLSLGIRQRAVVEVDRAADRPAPARPALIGLMNAAQIDRAIAAPEINAHVAHPGQQHAAVGAGRAGRIDAAANEHGLAAAGLLFQQHLAQQRRAVGDGVLVHALGRRRGQRRQKRRQGIDQCGRVVGNRGAGLQPIDQRVAQQPRGQIAIERLADAVADGKDKVVRPVAEGEIILTGFIVAATVGRAGIGIAIAEEGILPGLRRAFALLIEPEG